MASIDLQTTDDDMHESPDVRKWGREPIAAEWVPDSADGKTPSRATPTMTARKGETSAPIAAAAMIDRVSVRRRARKVATMTTSERIAARLAGDDDA